MCHMLYDVGIVPAQAQYNFSSPQIKNLTNFTLLQKTDIIYSHFSYACKMQYPLNLVLESWEYLWSYLTFWVVILDYGLKLHKLSICTLVMPQK